MIKIFCDACGTEITSGHGKEKVAAKDYHNGGTLRVAIYPVKGSYGEGEHFCLYCLLDTINTLDDRDKIMELPFAKERT